MVTSGKKGQKGRSDIRNRRHGGFLSIIAVEFDDQPDNIKNAELLTITCSVLSKTACACPDLPARPVADTGRQGYLLNR